MDKKFLLILAFIVLVGAILTSQGIIQLPQSSNTTLKTALPKLTGREIALRTTKFLDKTIKPDGSFQMTLDCKNKGEDCTPYEPTESSEQSGNGHIIDLYLNLWEETKDPSYREKADKAVAWWLSECEKEDGGVYGLGVSCRKNFRPFTKYYELTKDERYLNALRKVEGPMFTEKDITKIYTGATISKLSYMYKVTNDPKYKTRLTEIGQRILNGELDAHINKGTPLYKEGGQDINEELLILPYQAYLPIYNALQDPTYLERSKEIMDRSNATNHLNELKQAKNKDLYLILMEILHEIAHYTGDNKYLDQTAALGQEAYYDLADTPETSRFNSDYGFLWSFDEGPNKKKVTNSGWYGEIFLMIPDYQFSQSR